MTKKIKNRKYHEKWRAINLHKKDANEKAFIRKIKDGEILEVNFYVLPKIVLYWIYNLGVNLERELDCIIRQYYIRNDKIYAVNLVSNKMFKYKEYLICNKNHIGACNWDCSI